MSTLLVMKLSRTVLVNGILAIVIVAIIIVALVLFLPRSSTGSTAATQLTTTVQQGAVSSTITASGSIAADRVDAVESHIASFGTLRPDNPFTETGLRSEFTHGGFRSRFGKKRADLSHVWMDPLIVAGPWILAGAIVFSAVRAVSKPR